MTKMINNEKEIKKRNSGKPLRVVGKSVKRIDGEDKVRGKTKYGIDYVVHNMYVGKILRSPHAHARIISIDTSRAEDLPGVKAVITASDIPQNKYGVIKKDEYVFAQGKVRYQGEEVCGVVAIDEETAVKAIELIEVKYEIFKHVTHPLDAIKNGAPVIHEDCPDNIALHYDIERRDYKKAFRDAHVVVSGHYEIPMSHQLHLEPLAAVVEIVNHKLVVHAAAQEPFATRREIANCLGLEENDVIIHVLYAGGAFGARCDQKLPIIAAALAWKADVPVKLVNTREEDMMSGRPLMPVVVDVELALDKEGYFLGKRTKIIGENGAYSSLGPAVLSVAASRADSLYRYHSIFTEASLVYTNKPVTSAYRGFGNQQIHFPIECLIDEAAEALGVNPIDLRLKNATRKGDVSIHGYEINSCGLTECLIKIKEKYQELKQQAQEKTNPWKKRGIGVAALIHVSGNRTTMPEFGGSSAIVKILHNGKVQIFSGETCVGQGVHTVFAQIVAEELGLQVEDIEVILGNTDETPYALGCFASRVTTLGGKAVYLAAKEAAGKLKKVTAELWGEPIEEIELKDGYIFSKFSGQKLKFGEIARIAVFVKQSGLPLMATGVYEPIKEMPNSKTKYGNISSAYPFGAYLIEVEVDVKTGVVEVNNIIAVHDSGKVINPQMLKGQIEGGVVMGIGFTLFEEMIYIDGVLQNSNFIDYKIPTTMEIPSINIHLVEIEDPEGPYGAKGVGETPVIPVAPAISNAIFDATGVRVRRLPVTPERLYKLLSEQNAKC